MTFQVYLVGGAVRDALLGEPSGDRDWVVVGATPETLLRLGFTPVGRDFPVFLHPRSHAEYALARTERKSGTGYHGFSFHTAPDVSLDDDLRRRDLTINSIAVHAGVTGVAGLFEPKIPDDPKQWQERGLVVDPLGGRADLQARVLRHCGPAFSQDPVRLLRLARFAARWPSFSIARQTQALCAELVASGEVDHLVAERVWAELARALAAARPSRAFDVLRSCGALARLLPEIDRLHGVPQRADYHPEIDTYDHVMRVLDDAAARDQPLGVRVAALAHDLGKALTPPDVLPRHIGHEARGVPVWRALAARLRVPREHAELADLVVREHGNLHASAGFSPAALVRLLERCDAFRKPDRLALALQACTSDARGRLGHASDAYPQADRLLGALAAAQSVDTKSIAAHALVTGVSAQKPLNNSSHPVAAAIHAARVAAVAAWLGQASAPERT